MNDECQNLIDMLGSDTPALRHHAFRVLSRKKRFSCLERALESASIPNETKKLICEILYRTGWHEAIPILIKQLDSNDPAIRALAADAMAHIGEPAISSGPTLLRLLSDPSQPAGVKDRASLALGTIGFHEAWEELVAHIEDPEWTIRYNSVKALRFLKEPRAIQALQSALQREQDISVRKEILKALDSIEGYRSD